MIRFFCIILLAAASLLATPVYQATYNNGPYNDGSYIVGLSSITLAGQGTFDAMCFDFTEEISNGQTYQATLTKLTSYSTDPNTQAVYDMGGFIYLAMHDLPLVGQILHVTPDVAQRALQYGVWDLFDTNESDDVNIFHGFTYTNEIDGVVDFAVDHPGDLQKFTDGLQKQFPGALDNLYVVQGYGRDAGIQKFIIGGNIPSGVPEPGSLGLMGGGLIGIATLIRKRIAQK